MKIKLTPIFVAIILVAVILSGCNGTKESSNKTSDSNNAKVKKTDTQVNELSVDEEKKAAKKKDPIRIVNTIEGTCMV